MAVIKALDMKAIDDVFAMGGGYVLNFSDTTFAEFFAEDLNIDIGDPRYAQNGTSKAKRLRTFLRQVELEHTLRVLEALWHHRERLLADGIWTSQFPPNAEGRFLDLMKRLRASKEAVATTPFGNLAVGLAQPVPAFDKSRFRMLKADLMELQLMAPQARGYAFEKFLKGMFDAHGLQARESFRNRGEQIDGSFVHNSDVYLLEAKWQNELTRAEDLHAFHGKISEKATWTRGLFISYAGFTEVGLDAWGRGKSVVCMDGHDLNDLLDRQISFDQVLEFKVRRAAETGLTFIPVRDLFPAHS